MQVLRLIDFVSLLSDWSAAELQTDINFKNRFQVYF